MKMLSRLRNNHADCQSDGATGLVARGPDIRKVSLFLRYRAEIVFESSVVTYDRHERFSGESKYPLKRCCIFAVDGITSFSVRPAENHLQFPIFISWPALPVCCTP